MTNGRECKREEGIITSYPSHLIVIELGVENYTKILLKLLVFKRYYISGCVANSSTSRAPVARRLAATKQRV